MKARKSTHCWAGLGLCQGRGVTEVPGWARLANPSSLCAGVIPEGAWQAGEGEGESGAWRAQVASWAIPCLGTKHTLRFGWLLSWNLLSFTCNFNNLVFLHCKQTGQERREDREFTLSPEKF